MKKDILKIKTNELAAYSKGFDDAVASVTATINRLSELSRKMQETEQEIESYVADLESTKSGIAQKRARTDKVIARFTSLISEDD